ncbi:MAG: hypothetical protein SFW08_11840 [Gemmatimonadaceae bacterium]|nr:hypothetical protein [Gemmatimonadaceae bacterium]
MKSILIVPFAWLCCAATASAQGELRVTGLASPAVRNSAVGTGIAELSGGGSTVEVLARARYVGVHVRVFGADLSDGISFANGDVRAVLGPQALSAELGITRRAVAGPLGTNQLSYIRVGGRSTVPLGSSGLRAMVGVWSLQGSGLPGWVRSSRGVEGETALLYQLPRLPIFAQVGYRRERFDVSIFPNGEAPEEAGVMNFGVGLSFGGRNR